MCEMIAITQYLVDSFMSYIHLCVRVQRSSACFLTLSRQLIARKGCVRMSAYACWVCGGLDARISHP